jgi:hypothetical protein
LGVAAMNGSDFQQGYESGRRYVADVLRKRRAAHGRPGSEREREVHDMIELAASGFVPDDVIKQIQERVPPEARSAFEAGFVAACRDHIDRRALGLGNN